MSHVEAQALPDSQGKSATPKGAALDPDILSQSTGEHSRQSSFQNSHSRSVSPHEALAVSSASSSGSVHSDHTRDAQPQPDTAAAEDEMVAVDGTTTPPLSRTISNRSKVTNRVIPPPPTPPPAATSSSAGPDGKPPPLVMPPSNQDNLTLSPRALNDPYLLPAHSRDPSGAYDDHKEPSLALDMERVLQQRERLHREQQLRREYIAREQQKVLLMNEKEDAHWEKQDQRFRAMVERMLVGQQTCEELHNYLVKGARSLNIFAEALLAQPSMGTKEIGTLREAAIAQDILRNSIYEHHSEMKERVFADSIRQGMQLAVNMQKRTQALQQAGLRTGKSIRANRERVSVAWGEYEAVVNERYKAELDDAPVEVDPFLGCRVYEREQQEMRRIEQEYTKEMSKLFLELKVDDGRRIDAIKSILLDYLLAQKALLEHTVKFTENAIASVKAIDREKDVMEFVTHSDLLLNHSPKSVDGVSSTGQATVTGGAGPARATTIFEVPPPYRDPKSLEGLYRHELEKEGQLFRQGRWVKSNWKEIYCAVSRSGFFHYFDDPKDSTPALSVTLVDCQVRICPEIDKFAFVIEEPNKSFFNFANAPTKYYFKAESEEKMVDWMVAIKKYTERRYRGQDSASVGKNLSSNPSASNSEDRG